MPTRHIQIALTDALPGMLLSDPVTDTRGNVLLPGGTVLTEALLSSLQRHQIDFIAIATDAISAVDADAERDRQIARVEWLFRQPGAVANAATGAAEADPAGSTATGLLHQYMLNFRSGMPT